MAVAALILPEAVAYAGIAGLPPAAALRAAVAGCAIYGLIGRSRFAIVSPTSSSAAILAAILGSLGATPAERLTLAALTAVLVGFFFLGAALLRLGNLASFVSRPVLRGFAFGLSLTIVLRQIPGAIGISPVGGDIATLGLGILRHLPEARPASAAIAAIALAALIGLRRWSGIPAALMVLTGGITLSIFVDLQAAGVRLVGPIEMASVAVPPALPDWATIARLAQLALPLVLILFAESWGTIRSLALRDGDASFPGRELAALGLANAAAGLMQAMPVGAGFSASAANQSAGASSRAAALAAAAALALAVLIARPWIALLPEPVLAAIVVGALTHNLDPAPLLRLWRIKRDIAIAATAALGVLALGVVDGMLIAMLLSLISFIKRMAGQDLAQLGRLGTTHDFVDIARHPEAIARPDLLIWRPAQPLFFANAEPVFAAIARRSGPPATTVIVSLEESPDLDSTALDALLELDRRLAQRGIVLLLARVRDHLRDLLASAGATDLVRRSHYSVADAAEAATQSPKRGPVPNAGEHSPAF